MIAQKQTRPEDAQKHKKQRLNDVVAMTLDMPDKYDTNYFKRGGHDEGPINFLLILESSRPFVKLWIQSLIVDYGSAPNTARGIIWSLRTLVDFMYTEFGIKAVVDIKERHFRDFIRYLKNRVSMIEEEDSLGMETAFKLGLEAKRFLSFLEDEEVAYFGFLQKINIPKILPNDKPKFYFSGEALAQYAAEAKERKRKPIPYPDLIMILDSQDQWNDIYTESLITILSHTGLRVKEGLNLEIDAINPVADMEAKAASDKLKIKGGILPDWSNFYWLDNYKVSKPKQRGWKQGTPILVSQKVKDAIDRLTKHSKKARDALKGSGNEKKLFAHFNEQNKMKPGLLSDATIRYRLSRLSEKFSFPHFTPHQLRHTFAKLLHDSGIPLEYIRKYLNHIHSDMTSGYIERSEKANMEKYEEFSKMTTFAGGGKVRAEELRDRMVEAFSNTDFKAMTAETATQILEMIMDQEDMWISIMDHGICFMPKGTKCPNDYTEINSCLEENCGQFATTEGSIPHLTDLINYREQAIADLERMGFEEAACYNQKKLDKSINILKELKGGQFDSYN